jgi:hypothetical protein
MGELQPSKVELWGATLAARHLDDLQTVLIRNQEFSDLDCFIVFSFSGINSVSPSYLKRFLVSILEGEIGASEGGEIFPFVADLTVDVRDDLASFLNERGFVVREVAVMSEHVTHVRFVGDLERVAGQTLEALEKLEAASAVELHGIYGHLGIAQTAWNNRLANLHRMRLATRRKQGRSLIYQSTLKSKPWVKA